jgi:hypothetical protein
MKRWKWLFVVLLFAPLTLSAETISWLLPTTYVDNTAISAADRARITVYLRGWKVGNSAAKTYFGETRNGATSWGVAGDNTYIMNRMNEWGATNAVPGWTNVVPGDTIFVTASAALRSATDNVERDSPESPPIQHTVYKAPPPPVVVPSCNPPAGISIKP